MRWPPFLASRGWLLLLLVPFVLAWSVELAKYAYPLDYLFGGDSSNQMGIATHIWNGNAPWEDGSLRGESAFRDWLMYALVALGAKLLATTPLHVVRFWPVLVMAAGGVAVHGLCRTLFRREVYALLGAGVWMGIETTMLPTSRYFAALVTVPLFFWALAAYEPRLGRRIALGLAWGAASLSYLVAFFGTTLALALFVLRRARGKPRRTLQEAVRMWPTWAAGAPIVLALWGPIFLVYGGRVRNPSHLYGDAARGWTLEQSMAPLSDLVAHYGSPTLAGVSVLATLGLVHAWRTRHEPAARLTHLVLVVGLVGTYHWLVTMPLVGNHLVYYRWPTVFLRLAQALLVLHGVVLLDGLLARWRLAHGARSPLPWVALACVALLLPASLQMAYRDVDPVNRELAQDLSPDRRATIAAAQWLAANAPRDALVLATPMDGFAINALTGFDLVVQHRPHANAFADLDRRSADAAIMLHGQDKARSDELLRAYEVTHVFLSPLEQATSDFIPLMTSPDHADEWRANGIEFEETRLRYDPVGEGQLFDVIVPKDRRLSPAIAEAWEAVFVTPGASGDAIVLARR